MPKIEKIKIASIEDLHRSLDEKMSRRSQNPGKRVFRHYGCQRIDFRAYLANFENGEILVFFNLRSYLGVNK